MSYRCPPAIRPILPYHITPHPHLHADGGSIGVPYPRLKPGVMHGKPLTGFNFASSIFIHLKSTTAIQRLPHPDQRAATRAAPTVISGPFLSALYAPCPLHQESPSPDQRISRMIFPSTSAKRKTDPTIETKCCLSEAEGGVSSFCQVFFGYFL